MQYPKFENIHCGGCNQLCLIPAVVVEHRVVRVSSPSASGVSKQVVHGNVCHISLIGKLAVFCAEYSHWAKDFVGEVEFAVLDQGKDCDRSDWLGKIGDAEKGILLGLSHVLAICHAARVIVDKASVLRDGNRHGGYAVLLLKSLRNLAQPNTALIRIAICLRESAAYRCADDRASSGTQHIGNDGSAGESVHWHRRMARFYELIATACAGPEMSLCLHGRGRFR